MKLYTSYFARIHNLPKDILPISIARVTPAWYKGDTFQLLAPPAELLYKYKRTGDTSEYETYFNELFKKYPVSTIYKTLMSAGKDYSGIALICYEAPDKFCHRQIIANIFRTSGIAITEFEPK